MTDLGALTQTIPVFSVFLLYCLAGSVYLRWLMPLLNGSANRLAVAMLLAQLVLVGLGFFHQPATNFDSWLWGLDTEYNAFSTLATIQFALVGLLAILTGAIWPAAPAWRRLYFAGLGLLFVILAYDEYHGLRSGLTGWQIPYVGLGLGVASATALIASRSPRDGPRRMYICFLAGLALSSAGAIFLDAAPCSQGALGPWRINIEECYRIIVPIEEILEVQGIWLTLVAVLGHFSVAAPAPSRPARALLYALPFVCGLALIANSLAPRVESRLLAQSSHVQFRSDIALRAFHIDRFANDLALRLYVSAPQAAYLGLGYSIHLVDQVSGESVAGSDEWADLQHSVWLFGANYSPLYRQRLSLSVSPEAPVNRAYWIVLTLWRRSQDEFKRQKILSSDLQLLDDRQVVLQELVLSAPPALNTGPPASPVAVFDNGFTLETMELPKRARIGDFMPVAVSWSSAAKSDDSYIQFLHLGHDDSGAWWVYDQEPLGPRLPTRLWYTGLADSETWQAPLPADLAPGRYTAFTGLYRASDNERVNSIDADGNSFLDARVPLASLLIET